MENKEVITVRAFEARVRRDYEKKEVKLCKRRGKEAERKGEYFGIAGALVSFDADLRTLVQHARADNLLKPHEVVEVLPGVFD